MRTSAALGLAAIGAAVMFSSSARAEEPATKPAEPAATTTSDGTVMVHINAATPVTLQRRANDKAPWETACVAPCNQKLSVADEYQVVVPSGDSPPSNSFHLQAKDGKVTLDVAPGNKSRATVGTALLITGAVIAVTGIIVTVAFAAKSPAVAGADGATTSDNSRMLGIGAGALVTVGGVALGWYGLGTQQVNSQTIVGGDVQGPQPAHGASEPLVRVAQTKPSFLLPIFSGKF